MFVDEVPLTSRRSSAASLPAAPASDDWDNQEALLRRPSAAVDIAAFAEATHVEVIAEAWDPVGALCPATSAKA